MGLRPTEKKSKRSDILDLCKQDRIFWQNLKKIADVRLSINFVTPERGLLRIQYEAALFSNGIPVIRMQVEISNVIQDEARL